jgi:DNA invertase Pin-like site-specific DNA recombinase
MTYGYVRVSSITQNTERQEEEMKKLKIPEDSIYTDKESGKNFDRKQYKELIKIIKKDDLLIIKSIDRLGRNYKSILDEWHKITKEIKADIFVIDMPLLDTRTNPENLVGTFISDLVLQILSFVAETERDNIKKRQMEGIKIAKANGKHLGRPKHILPKNFLIIKDQYLNSNITSKEACAIMQMNRSTFYKYVKCA